MRHRSASNRPTAPAPNRGSRGSMIIYLVAALAVLGVISIAATGFFSSSQVGTARTNCAALARHLSESGIRYAESQVRAAADLAALNTTVTALDGTTYTVNGAGTFDLTVGAPADNGNGVYEVTISCIGTACTADSPTPSTTNAGTVASNVATPTGGGEDPEPNGEISIGDGVENFTPVTGGDDGDDMIQTDPENNSVSFGNGTYRSYGCFWYNSDEGGCSSGVCPFGSGLRAYMRVMLSPGAEADGFVFTIINADDNETNDCGGDADMGELLGYGGPGNNATWVKGGLQPPKLGLEFDIYANTGDGDATNPGNRNDDPASRDHSAWIFWGTDDWVGDTYDDNQHGTPKWSSSGPVPYDANEPTNPENIGETGNGADGYYYDEEHGGNWLRGYNADNEDKKFRVRVEVDRLNTRNADNNYCYTLRGWIVRDEVEVPDSFFDLSTDYYDPADESTWPQVEHAVVLKRSLHEDLDNVIIGVTSATGGATSTIYFDKLDVTFKHDETTCAEETKPADYMMAFPFSRGQGNQFDYMASPSSRRTGSINGAYWLKGKSCPECSSLFFDDNHGPAVIWGYHISNDFRTTGTASAWINIKDYNDFAGVFFRGNSMSAEALTLQFSQDNFSSNGNTIRFNEDRRSGGRYYIDDGEKKPALCLTDTAGKTYCVNSKYEMELETWYHIAATWDTTTDVMQFYVNGVLEETFRPNADYGWDMQSMYSPWNLPIVVGTQTTSRGTYSFHGMIDDVYLYDEVLTADEIAALYNDGLIAPKVP